jgi:hypothetical protein
MRPRQGARLQMEESRLHVSPLCSHMQLADTAEIAIYRVCTLHSDLSSIPLKKFQKWTNSAGQRFYKVNFDLQVSRVSEVGSI